MTRYDSKIIDLKNRLSQTDAQKKSILMAWAQVREQSSESAPGLLKSPLEACLAIAADVQRETGNLEKVESLMSRLTSLQSRRRDLQMRQAQLIRSQEPVLSLAGQLGTQAYHRHEAPWSHHPHLFSQSEHYETQRETLIEHRTRLSAAPKASFWEKLKSGTSSLFNTLRLKYVETRRQQLHLRAGLQIALNDQLYTALGSLVPPERTSALGDTVVKLREFDSAAAAIGKEEEEIRQILEQFGAQKHPARRVGELRRTLQILLEKQKELRIQFGNVLYQESLDGTMNPRDSERISFLGPLEENSKVQKELQNELVRTQAAADIEVLEETNLKLDQRIRDLEDQIRQINLEIQRSRREIQENQDLIESKKNLRDA